MAKKERIAQKAAADAEKKTKQSTQKEAEDAAKWSDGAKDSKKKQLEEEKRQEALAKKKEREALLAEEEKELASVKAPVKGSAKKAAQRTERVEQYAADARADIPEYAASGIDAALDLMDVSAVGTKGKSSDKIERHPEKRMKSAWAAFEEREMPILKAEQPGLRLSQYKQVLQKKWKKSPENPMNQQTISYDTARQEEREIVAQTTEKTLESMRVK
ncbi:hypothetical protein SpCBS45565_g04115 [Spizellomyces sp. 'palustris']|nr:hypothetical protein SpCBS45565_g04115 [Spizellomyces sp. 'palustris']